MSDQTGNANNSVITTSVSVPGANIDADVVSNSVSNTRITTSDKNAEIDRLSKSFVSGNDSTNGITGDEETSSQDSANNSDDNMTESPSGPDSDSDDHSQEMVKAILQANYGAVECLIYRHGIPEACDHNNCNILHYLLFQEQWLIKNSQMWLERNRLWNFIMTYDDNVDNLLRSKDIYGCSPTDYFNKLFRKT